MKKFYNNTLTRGAFSKALRLVALLCVLMGVSSSAWADNIYVTGDAFDGWGKWTQMTSIGDNKYTCVIKNSSGKFKLSSSEGYGNTWNNLSCGDGSVTCNGANDHQINKAGVLYFEWKDNGYVWVEENSSSGCDPSADIYLTGSFNSWNTAQANYKLTANPGNDAEVMIKGVTLSANAEFKVFQGCFYGYENLVQTDDNKGFVANTDGNIKVTKAGTYDVYFDKNDHHIYIGLNVPCTEDDSNLGECDRIEVYCRYTENDNCNMKIYAYSSCTSKILNSNGTAGNSGEKVNVNGTNYAKWVFPTTGSNICVKFISGTDASYATTVRCNLSSGYKYYFTLPSGWGNQSFDPTSEKISCGGGDDPDDPSDVPSCDAIEIWCKGEGGYIGMHCYAWHPDNNSDNPLDGWPGCTTSKTGMYNGVKYAVWTVTGKDRLNIIFNNGGDGCKTNDIVGLEKGNRYIYTLASSWCGTTPTCKVINCEGGGEVDVVNGTVYLDVSSFKDWLKEGAIFKAVLTKKAGGTETKNMIQCASETNVFYVDEVLNLTNYSKIQVLRCNPADGGQWNYSSTLNLSPTTTCVKVTGWDNTGSITKYTGSCGVSTNTPVYLTNPAVVGADGRSVTMYAYLSETYCTSITEYGFVYCPGTLSAGCTPTASSPKLKVGNGNATQIFRGEAYQLNTSALSMGKTYGYKAYVKIGNMTYLSAETGYFKLSDCNTRPEAESGTITYTVNAALGEDYEDDCTLTYGNLQTAIDRLKQSYSNPEPIYQYVTKNGDSYNLRQPIVMKVHYYDDTPDDDTIDYIYRGTTNIGKYAGNAKPTHSNLLENINRSSANAANTLTIKAGDNKAKPWVHHIVLRNSKNIVLDSLAIFSDPADSDPQKAGTQTIGDNAIEMDKNIASGDAGWNTLNTNGYVDDANIVVQNCMIGSDGFTGAHISSYDGVTFKNCDFESVFNDPSGNAIAWGASFKLLYCKNIKFIQNNFRGDHATLMWIQEVQNMLVMNNVFWNTNKFLAGKDQRNPAAMRLVTQWNPVKNVGFYYNTYFFADNGITSSSTYDFMSFAETADINVATVEFKYNNCYSYDKDCPGKSGNPFNGKSIGGNYASNFCPNNFWSQYDELNKKSSSVFAFGDCDDKKFINVAKQVCSTTASGPASLQIKGQAMDLGIKPDITKTGITLTADEWYSDRYLKDQRPKTNQEWTYGAYQSKDNVETQYIYWVGISEDWDDRNNWEYEVEDDKTRALVRQRLSCVNTLSPNLIAVIEEKGTVEVAGGRKWPCIPDSFTGTRSNQKDAEGNIVDEHVSAGLGTKTTTELFAKTIIVEAGAAIKGVEHLKNGSLHYQDATVQMNAPRSKWVLVGGVVKPFSENGNPNSALRDIVSGDYFKDYMPQVYMHQAEIDGTNATWARTFPDLDVPVLPQTVFAINIPDEYGDYKLPAAYYNKYFGGDVDGEAPVLYEFNGRFADDDAMRTYSDLTAGVPTLINNTYPCNLDARKVEEISGGTVLFYNYEAATFMSTASTAGKVLLRPQHGFIFTPAAGKDELEITKDMIADGNTRSRSAAAIIPTISINLFNANTQKGFSNIVLHYNAQVEITNGTATDAEKVFAPNADSPELYIMANDKKYTRFTAGSTMVTIPLGIHLQKDMNVKFAPVYFEGLNEVILFDAFTGQTIDLLRHEFTTESLIAGDIEGRYFLNIELKEESDYVPDEEIETDIEESIAPECAINIYTNQATGNEISIVTANVELQTIYVSDMTGKTVEYKAVGNNALLRLSVAPGAYIVKVVGDKLTRTEKVILK